MSILITEPEHEVICGTIGMGKSYWVVYKIVKSLLYDRPCCYIDPKGDTYRSLLTFFATTTQGQELWERYHDRILLLNPVSLSGYILGFNAIEPMEEFLVSRPDRVALLADNFTSHIRRQSGMEVNEAMRMQNILSAAIGILAQGGHGKYTIAEFPYLFLPPNRVGKEPVKPYNPFVESLLPNITHSGTNSFWRLQWPTMLPNDRRQWVQSSEGRIYPYIFDERSLMTTCTVANSRLDFKRLVEEGYWLFVNLPYPLLSEAITTLIGNLVITKIFYACMQRPPDSRHYRIILDEAKFFSTGPLDRLLETSRAYNLWLTLVVQSLNQLCRSREGRIDYSLRDIVVSVVRYWSSFSLTQSEDVEILASMMYPLTGMRPRMFRNSGDPDFFPAEVEKDQNARRFMNLGMRQMIMYDKFDPEQTRIYKTPEVIMDKPVQAELDRFEAEQLRRTGRPASEIMKEIEDRRAAIWGMLNTAPPPQPQAAPPTPSRKIPKAQFGGN